MPAETPDPSRDGNTRPSFPVAAAIFDFDETIIDLEPQHTAAYVALCRDLGSDYETMPESFRTGSGRRVIDDIRAMRAHFGWSEGERDLLARRQQHFDHVVRESDLDVMPGVREILAAFSARRIPLAIASSAVRASIEAILDRLALRHYFDLIVDGSEVTHGKPDPEAYLVTASRLGVEPRACIVFEDSEVGVLSAKAAGAYCVAVRNPRALSRQDLSAADAIVESMSEVDVEELLASGLSS